MLVDEDGLLRGIFTDSDLARLLEAREEAAIDDAICHRMTRNPTTISSGRLIQEAFAAMSQLRISELPVVDSNGKPIGLIDITDLVALAEPSLDDPPSHAKHPITLSLRNHSSDQDPV